MSEITEMDYAAWKHSPTSKFVRQFLSDYRDMLIKEALAQWRNGAIELSTEHELRARITTIDEMLNLEYSHIKDFYLEDKDATQVNTTYT